MKRRGLRCVSSSPLSTVPLPSRLQPHTPARRHPIPISSLPQEPTTRPGRSHTSSLLVAAQEPGPT
jgi:hypothetical protein